MAQRQPKQTKPRRKSESGAPKKLLSVMEGWDYVGRPCGVNAWYDAVKPKGAFGSAVITVGAKRKFLSRERLDRIVEGAERREDQVST